MYDAGLPMPQHQLFGGIIALSGIANLALLILVVLPRIKGTKEYKKKRSTTMMIGGVAMIVIGAVMAFAGEGWFA